MQTATPSVTRVKDVKPGSLFILVGSAGGNAICLRAKYDLPSENMDEDEANRVVPLSWPGDMRSVGEPIYASALSGLALVLKDACIEVDPLSSTSGEIGSLNKAYGYKDRLYLPISYNGRVNGFVDTESGIILPNRPGDFVGFTEWRVTLPWNMENRRVIVPASKSDVV